MSNSLATARGFSRWISGAAQRAARYGTVLALLGGTACSSTDKLGDYEPNDGQPPPLTKLNPLSGPSSYPNAFVEDLGLTQAEVNSRLEDAFRYLFVDPETRILKERGTDQAAIEDTLHEDIRTEGMGFGMMIAVQLSHRTEFDKLWAYSKALLRKPSGPVTGYFTSFCHGGDREMPQFPDVCLDPFGLQQFTMALIFAHERWGSSGRVDYEADAIELLRLMREKETTNGGIKDGVTNTFDATSLLVYDRPTNGGAQVTRPSIEIPAFYQLWQQATGDEFWGNAAQKAREYLRQCENAKTGLMPVRSDFECEPVMGGDYFDSEAYRTHLNFTLDWIWFGQEDDFIRRHANRLLDFFVTQGGPDEYPRTYTLDGVPQDKKFDQALMAMNGAIALPSSVQERTQFMQEVWDLTLPLTGDNRYYPGILHMMALLVLSGNYQVR